MHKTNVVIVGSGLVGGVVALSLARAGIESVILDNAAAFNINQNTDGRTTAVSYGSREIFVKLGLWGELASHAQPIKEIRVFEEGSAWTVDYDYRAVGPHPMGYIIENRLLRHSLQGALENNPLITNLTKVNITGVERLPFQVITKLDNGQVFSSPLIVGAEGRNSPLRNNSNIQTKTWDYNQTALVAHFSHQKPHQDRAFEIFMPTGPLAILPLLPSASPDSLANKYRSGLVWIKSLPSQWQGVDRQDINREEITAELTKLFPFYGGIEIYSDFWVYPLSALTVNSFIDHRLALVGDAAHVVHPIAGQGVNLGWRDGDALARHLINAHSLGLDMGSDTVLANFNKQRYVDQKSVLWVTDGIHRLFSYNNSLAYFARNFGMAVTNQLPSLKQKIMKKAMGM